MIQSEIYGIIKVVKHEITHGKTIQLFIVYNKNKDNDKYLIEIDGETYTTIHGPNATRIAMQMFYQTCAEQWESTNGS